MDRLLTTRGLVALGGLALMMASSGCRDRNLQVPPPAHYTEGTAPEAGAYSASPMTPTDPATIDPYGGAGYGAAGSYDPAASPTAGTYDPAAGGAAYGSMPAASSGAAPATSAAPSSYGASTYGETHPSPSSPAPAAGASYGAAASSSPAAGTGAMPSAAADDGAPASMPDLDGGVTAPPVPGDLPMMP